MPDGVTVAVHPGRASSLSPARLDEDRQPRHLTAPLLDQLSLCHHNNPSYLGGTSSAYSEAENLGDTKLYIPAVLAAIVIALTGCGGGEKPASSTTAAKATSTATARAKVPDLVGKTLLEAKSELGKINYYASISGPDGVK